MASDFQRVVGCWPASELTWTVEEEGDEPRRTFTVLANTSGKVEVKVTAGSAGYRDLAVWYAYGIFRIAKVGNTKESLDPIFVLDYAKRNVRLDIDSFGQIGDPPFRLAPEESLRGCTVIPKVDIKQPMSQPPKRRPKKAQKD